jgi:hypothetical protein
MATWEDKLAHSDLYSAFSFLEPLKSSGSSQWEWGNVPEKTRNEFHAKDATIAKRYRPVGPALTALCSRKAVPPSGSRYRVIFRTASQRLGSAFIFQV